MFRKLRYHKENSLSGPRVGGAPPCGQENELTNPDHRYFGTFPIFADNKLEFSVYHRFDPLAFGPEADGWIWDHRNTALGSGELIWAIVHPESTRSTTIHGSYEPLSLVFVDDGSIYTDNQLGGDPSDQTDAVLEIFDTLRLQGYKQLLQLRSWHSGEDHRVDWRSDPRHWPWEGGAGMLHVFAQNELEVATWRFVIQQ